MKVGVITFHSAFNFGASLQCLALQKSLEKMGVEPCVINYHPEAIDRIYRVNKAKNPIKHIAKDIKLRLLDSEKIRRYNRYTQYIRDAFYLMGDYRTPEELKENPPILDAYITGSDQVWNSGHTKSAADGYYLNFVPEAKLKFSYGASIGKNVLTVQEKKALREALKSYTTISVRERSAVSSIEELTDKKIEVVPDPTLLLKPEQYRNLEQKLEIKEKYILVYMMECNQKVINFANRISRSLGLPIVQRLREKSFDNAKYTMYAATPPEFLWCIDNAELVITNSFHGTVFASIFEKPFISMLHSETGGRIVDLLRELELTSHLLESPSEFEDLSQFYIVNLEDLRARREQLREQGLDFLKRSLKLSYD